MRNVSNTRAIVWGHSAHWLASHPRANLGVHYEGRWASQLFATGHSIRQDMPGLPIAGPEPSRIGVQFDVSAPGNSDARMRAFVQLRGPDGQVLGGRSLAVSPSGAAWQSHGIVLPVSRVPAGARVQVAFVRDDAAGGTPVAITGVRAWQSTGE
ncbi:hypothetical protein L2Y96_06300 [Luteibacter aegosomaticola]|uniref:hypothetical protein n=1 Tax=Luteibacter aegosomaticola TaxID=2911538 RepID=UPI001FFB26E2|nr:hypothetical protein [Luteibacter aegosomaticola]UPG91381.1 hypothetical protein L2Y96_06300 [Luteibacter aegosomaticola]